MQSTNIRQIKAALVDQAFFGKARVSCAIGVGVYAGILWTVYALSTLVANFFRKGERRR